MPVGCGQHSHPMLWHLLCSEFPKTPVAGPTFTPYFDPTLSGQPGDQAEQFQSKAASHHHRHSWDLGDIKGCFFSFPLNSAFQDAGHQQLRENFWKNKSVFYFKFLPRAQGTAMGLWTCACPWKDTTKIPGVFLESQER